MKNPEEGKEFSLEKLKGDASTRSYYRLNFADPGATPPTMVMMKREKGFHPEKDDWLFMQKFLKRCRVPVPGVYYSNPGNGAIYLEDCGDRLMEEEVIKEPEKKLEHYKRAIDFLLIMQVECTRRLDEENPAGRRRFDHEKYMFELNHTLKWFIKEHNKKELTPGEEERIQSFFESLIDPMLKEPTVFTHRDYHSRNILLKNGKYYILDFQDARMGPMQYDLASLLFDSYVKLTADERETLLGYYFARLKFPVRDTPELKRFMDIFYRTALQRNIKALGTFGYQAECAKNPFYLRFVPDTIDYVKANLYKVRLPDGERKFFASLLEKN